MIRSIGDKKELTEPFQFQQNTPIKYKQILFTNVTRQFLRKVQTSNVAQKINYPFKISQD